MMFGKNQKRGRLQQRRRRYRILGLSVAALVMAYFALMLVFNDRGLLKLVEVFKTHRHLNQEIQRLQERNEELRLKVKALKTDSEMIEAIARQELGLVKKGELIYQFKQEPKQEPADE